MRAEGFFWLIASLVLLVIAILHPRIIFLVMILICMISSLVCFKGKKSKQTKSFGSVFIRILCNIVVIVLACWLGRCLDVFFPYHAPYEYKKDIMMLKGENEGRYYFFPDEIPDSASNIEWVCSPGMMQGTSCQMLFFRADQEYIHRIIDDHQETATIYMWDNEVVGWVNLDLEKEVMLGECKQKIGSTERKDVIVYVLYDNMDPDHLRNAGFYVNEKSGYICFFAQ